jgi:nucleoside-diphosphate-sugar epimerase
MESEGGSGEFWRGKRVMVTGGNGFLGKYVVRKLRERGAQVLVADMDPSATLMDPSARLRVDLRRLGDIRRALSEGRPQVVIHLAAQSHVRVSFDLPEYTGDVLNIGLVMLKGVLNIKVFGAGSREKVCITGYEDGGRQILGSQCFTGH